MGAVGKNIDWKQGQLKEMGKSWKGLVRITSEGNIREEDMEILRVVLNESPIPNRNIRFDTGKDGAIKELVKSKAKVFQPVLKLNSFKSTEEPNLARI